jgi:hypothetical protein
MNSKILISVVIVLAIGVAAAGYQISTTNNLLTLEDLKSQNPDSDSSPASSSDGSGQGSSSGSSSASGSSQGSSNVKVTPSQAKTLAKTSIDYDGAYAGTPTLKSLWGTKVYIVPVMIKQDGKEVRIGEIYIDAITGKNLKGAGGGAP